MAAPKLPWKQLLSYVDDMLSVNLGFCGSIYLIFIPHFFFQALESIKCNNFLVTPGGNSILFKEWDLVVSEEDEVEISKN